MVMTDEATPKKKRGCLKIFLWAGGGLVGLFVVLAIVSTFYVQGLKGGCNSGKAEDCEKLLEGSLVDEDFDLDQITNEEYKPKFAAKVETAKKTATAKAEAAKKAAAAKAEADKKAAEAKEAEARIVDALVQAMAACEKSLKAAMKDPDSFKVHNRDFATLQIEYSATNSFGARIRNVIDCRTGQNLR